MSCSPSTCATALILFVFHSWAHGYEVRTHGQITEQAVLRSRFATVTGALGIDSLRKLPSLTAPPFAPAGETAVGWLIQGSILEDGESPLDARPRHHFYNPLNGQGLTGVFSGRPSIDWGLEDAFEFGEQTYSLRDAREYLWAGLLERDPTMRIARFADTFRSIGQVVHLIEDLAQAQHTRNDSHIGVRVPRTPFQLGGSGFENYALALANAGQLDFGAYPVVDMRRARDFWTRDDRAGLADFSNRNFVTTGSNFIGSAFDGALPAPGFPEPQPLAVSKENIAVLRPDLGIDGVVAFVPTTIHDAYSGETLMNPRGSTYGLLDDDLRLRGGTARFSLNSYNHAEAIRILVPRAVGYSAGLIDHFFRGTIEVQPPASYLYSAAPYSGGLGKFDRLRARIRNSTEGHIAGAGTLYAVVRHRTSTENLLENPGADLSADETYAISAEQLVELGSELTEVTFDFSATPIPVNAADVHLTIAFRGPLTNEDGDTEDAILIGGKDLYEPDRLRFVNTTDYFCNNGTLHDVMDPAGRDLDGDGNADLPAPYLETRHFAVVEGLSDPWGGWPDESRNHFHNTDVPAAHFGSIVVLQDAPRYRVTEFAHGHKEGYWNSLAGSYEKNAQINRVVYTSGGSYHQVTMGGSSFRGSLGVQHHVSNHIDENWWDSVLGACARALITAPRNIIEKEGQVHAFADPTEASS